MDFPDLSEPLAWEEKLAWRRIPEPLSHNVNGLRELRLGEPRGIGRKPVVTLQQRSLLRNWENAAYRYVHHSKERLPCLPRLFALS